AAEAALLRAQAADGRWSAAATDDDEAATGLALLALLAERPQALASPPVARAVADATRWLRARQADDGGFGRGARSERGHALATEALLEVWAQTGDPGLRHALVPAVRRLATDAHGTPVGDATEWTRRALARAHGLGWRTPADAPTTTSSSWALPGAPQASQCARVLAFIAQ
ncbi:MAG TPA: hypothetical protein VND21_03735, partial [Planctomycetota bacterium]|nr:hypothetical protein [Planctomycetota bacterium]